MLLNNKIHFFLADTDKSASFKEKNGLKITVLLIHKQQRCHNDSAGFREQDLKKTENLLAPGTNQIASGFAEFRPLTNWEKIICFFLDIVPTGDLENAYERVCVSLR